MFRWGMKQTLKYQVHQYKNNGYNIVLDVNSGAVHVVNDVVYDVLALYEQCFKMCGGQDLLQELVLRRKDKYPQEEIAEGISCLIYLSHEMNPVREGRTLWLDTSYVNSNGIRQLIVEACKRNLLIEWELMINYLGYSVKRDGDQVCIKKRGPNGSKISAAVSGSIVK